MAVKRRCYSSTLFSLFMNASQIQQEFWTYFLCFLSIKNQHSLCVIGWLLTSLSNCINNVQDLSWQCLQLLDRWVQMYLSSARAKVSFLALDPVTSTSSDKHAFFSVSSRRVLIFPSLARWHKLCPWNKIGWVICLYPTCYDKLQQLQVFFLDVWLLILSFNTMVSFINVLCTLRLWGIWERKWNLLEVRHS